MSDGDALILLQNIQKNFFYNHVLQGVNVSIFPGRFYALLGENGSGKSTLLKIMMGVEKFDQGCGRIFNTDLNHDLTEIKQKLGFVSESIEFDLNIPMKKFFHRYGQFFKNWDENFFQYLIDQRKIDLSKRFKDLSRGQKMQICLIVALSIKPQIIFIDEVTSVLDVYARQFFMSLLHQKVQEGMTVIITTNIISEVQTYASDILLLKKGKIELNLAQQELHQHYVKFKVNVKNNSHDNLSHDNLSKYSSDELNQLISRERGLPVGIDDQHQITYVMPSLNYKNIMTEAKRDESNIVKKVQWEELYLTLEDIFIYYTQHFNTDKKEN